MFSSDTNDDECQTQGWSALSFKIDATNVSEALRKYSARAEKARPLELSKPTVPFKQSEVYENAI